MNRTIRKDTSAAATHKSHSRTVAKSFCMFVCLGLGGATYSWSQRRGSRVWVAAVTTDAKGKHFLNPAQKPNRTAGSVLYKQSKGGVQWGKGFPSRPATPLVFQVCLQSGIQAGQVANGMTESLDALCWPIMSHSCWWMNSLVGKKRSKYVVVAAVYLKGVQQTKGWPFPFLLPLHHTPKRVFPFSA